MTVSAETIEKYLAIPSAGGGTYHPDRPEIAFISSESGVYQVYVRNLETGETRRISQGDDRSTNPVYLPNGDLLYVTDAGGNEKYQFMVYDGAESWRLTGSLDAKHNFAFASDSAVYFSANIDDPERLDVYRYMFPLSKGQQPALVMRAESGYPLRPEAVNEDDTCLIVSRVGGNLKNDLLRYDLATREITPLTAQAFPGHNNRFNPVEFLEPTKLLLTSDYGREFLSLAVLDLDTLALTWLEGDEHDTGEVELFDGNRLLYSKNVDGADRLFKATVTDGQLEGITEIRLPDEFAVMPSGDFRSYTKSFIPNAKGKAILTCSAPALVTTVMEVDLATGKLVPVLAQPDFDGPAFIPTSLNKFKSFDGLEVPYYLYTPVGEGPFPVIFIIHGGPEGQTRSTFSNVVQLFLRAGYMVVEPNIRGSNGYGRGYLALDDVEKRLDSIRDIASLAEHIKSNPRADANKLVVYGGSYGGFAVLSCITEFPDLFAAAVDVVGISNFVTFLTNTAAWRRRLREAEYGSLERDRDFLESVSPINKVAHIQTPLLIVQGRNDERVPLSESEQMHAALKARNVPCDLLVFDDEGHGVVKRHNQVTQFKAVFEFLGQHLR